MAYFVRSNRENMDYLSFLLCILLSWAAIRYVVSHLPSSGSRLSKKRLPPGPAPLPIVGNLFELGSRPHESLAKLAKQYGPVMCLQIGSLTTIVVSSASIAKEVLQKSDPLFKLFNTMISQRLARKEGCFDDCEDALDALLKISADDSEELELSHIPHILLDLFAEGSETTPSTIEWAMAELLRSPDKMKKAKEEIEYVVGKGITVNEEDIVRLPYLQCVVKEAFRMHPPAPFLVPRKTESDVELCGFTVPKYSQVLVNVWAMGRDPSLWENAGCFEPERFFGAEIDVKGQDFELIPFGAGHRICPGLPLALRMLPPMLGSLINCFDWRLEDGVAPQNIDMSDRFGITLQKARPLRAIPISIM